MKYENQTKLNSVLTEIINNENKILVDRVKELEEWKKNNSSKIKECDKQKNIIIWLENYKKMLIGNIKQFMLSVWATYYDESWQDVNWETGECWGEDILYWKLDNEILSLTDDQTPKTEKVEVEKGEEVPF